MSEDSLVEQLTKAAKKVGLTPMSQDEFDGWWAKAQEYRNSEAGKIEADTTEIQLDYLLDRAKYKFTESMGEISGMGGSYEKACRVMLDAGLRWMDDNPTLEPQFSEYEGIYGIISKDNEAAKSLSKRVSKAAPYGCTGAMHQAVITNCLRIRKHGWEFFQEKMSKEASQ